MRIKSVNALMKYLRDKKNISIGGQAQKLKLRQIGYYHGYKGYRFFNRPQNSLAYTNFNELLSVYAFDMQLKSIMYPMLMQLETALKNFALEAILDECQSEKFTDIFSKVLNHHNDFSHSDKNFNSSLEKELSLRNKIYSNLSRDYKTKLVVQHFYEKDQPVPIWAIFETTSLGEFGTLLQCMNSACARKVASSVGLNTSYDADGTLLTKIVFILKDLRNAVAHNDPVFDVRFKTSRPNKRIPNMLSAEMGVRNIVFETITDYFLLVSFLLKILRFPKTDIRKFIADFQTACDNLHKKVPFKLYSTIIHTDMRPKIASASKWL
ncbi:MAG: Abi family protein [Clostridia bacterium]|nr:Abi family protein [Oscillospiraceae bacterium]MBQ9942770.1 Abi family protein [Clostridia bacterium]